MQKLSGNAAFLVHSDIFRHLSAEELNALGQVTTLISCPSGRIFYRPGETGSTLFLLKAGRVQLYHLSTDGRKLITATLEAGACFGTLPPMATDVHTCFAETVEDSLIGLINKQDLEPLLLHYPRLTLALLQLVGQRLTQLEAQLIDTTFKSATSRLAVLLLQLALPREERGQQRLAVAGKSHEELAEHLGVYRETVSSSLRELREAGAIELGRKYITISEPTRLEEIAESGGKGGRLNNSI